MSIFLLSPALADDLWIEAAASSSIVNGHRFRISRTLNNYNLDGVNVGLSHAKYEDAWWALAEAGISKRFGSRLVVQSGLQIGLGSIEGRDIRYTKLLVGGNLALSREWYAQLSDTYYDIADVRGHIIDFGMTRATSNGLSITVNGLASAGSAIETRQLGIKFSLQKNYTYIGGLGTGETRNPIILNEFGDTFGDRVVAVRQVYAGIGIPFDRFKLLTVFDYLRLDDVARRELSLVLQVPLGGKTGGSR